MSNTPAQSIPGIVDAVYAQLNQSDIEQCKAMRRTTQIVIHGRARKVSRVQWSFAFVAASPIGIARRGRAEEPQLPL